MQVVANLDTSEGERNSVEGMYSNVKNGLPAKYTSISSKELKHLVRSFSQSDLSKFNVSYHTNDRDNDENVDSRKTKSIKNGLRADFIHLQGLQVQSEHVSKRSKLSRFVKNAYQEGFKLRSLNSFYSTEGNRSDPQLKTIVVIPSIDLDGNELTRMCDSIQFYEERQLYHLFLTRDPSVRVIFLSSDQVDEGVVGYYLRLCQNEEDGTTNHFLDVHDKLSRVFMIHVPSSQCIPLSEKILHERKLTKLLNKLVESPFYERKCMYEANRSNMCAGLSVFTGSNAVSKISTQIGVRLLEAHEHQLHYGTKQGSREIFDTCDIPFPPGTPDLCAGDDDLLSYGELNGKDECSYYWAYDHRYIRSSRCLAIGMARQIARGTKPKKWIIKLNQGFSGKRILCN